MGNLFLKFWVGWRFLLIIILNLRGVLGFFYFLIFKGGFGVWSGDDFFLYATFGFNGLNMGLFCGGGGGGGGELVGGQK
jgi:hypothetical protein